RDAPIGLARLGHVDFEAQQGRAAGLDLTGADQPHLHPGRHFLPRRFARKSGHREHDYQGGESGTAHDTSISAGSRLEIADGNQAFVMNRPSTYQPGNLAPVAWGPTIGVM